MTDIYDRASEHEEADRAIALQEQARRAGLTGKTVADSAETCHICEAEIPQARREALPGVQTCVDCQAELEHAANQVF